MGWLSETFTITEVNSDTEVVTEVTMKEFFDMAFEMSKSNGDIYNKVAIEATKKENKNEGNIG